MISVSPVGAVNSDTSLTLLVSIKERLCKAYSVVGSVAPKVNVNYTADTPILIDGAAVKVPVTASISVAYCPFKCGRAVTQLFTEKFDIYFYPQVALPRTYTFDVRTQEVGAGNVNPQGFTREVSTDNVVTATITLV